MKLFVMGEKKGNRLFTVLAAAALLLFSGAMARAAEKEILILHTNNVTGYLLPCPT